MHYQPSNFWKPSDFGIQQSIFTVKITAMYSAHKPACEAIKNMQIDLRSVELDPRIPNINKQLFFFVSTRFLTLEN